MYMNIEFVLLQQTLLEACEGLRLNIILHESVIYFVKKE